MNIIRLSLFVAALALLGGCVAVPVAPGYYAGSPDYYSPAPVYFAPPPVHVAPRIHIRPHTAGEGHGGKRGSARGPGRGPARGPGRDHKRR